ncbi:RNA polymerase sigma factor [Sphingomonas hankookensis]|uniref:RNA polymerase subunit sigma-24 n=1 Tax=Sphingomonas hengshuiensis TaxID=1609977 RepID=A0A2W4YXM3_9SPHN|nr:MAG: RNA polymerase subunit sigma-24 [Sphingomonas hengshuiensis]
MQVDHQLDLGRRWRPALLAYFLRRVRDHAEAEDLTQETLARLVDHRDGAFASPEAYIFRMASNLLADRARRLRVRAQYRDLVGRVGETGIDMLDPFRIASGREEISALADALAALPERTRSIFILYRLENIGQEKIAEAFGISASAVKKHVARAMATLMRDMRNGQ